MTWEPQSSVKAKCSSKRSSEVTFYLSRLNALNQNPQKACCIYGYIDFNAIVVPYCPLRIRLFEKIAFITDN